MIELTFSEAAAACSGILVNGSEIAGRSIAGVVIDSRERLPDSLFVALHGARADGHQFIGAAMHNGAVCAISEVDVPFPHIRVPSSLTAMQMLAAYIRQKSGIPVIAVVGSVGKTSTRQMLSCVLSQKYNILSTEGNLNNEYGLPQTLFRLEREHELAVLELGISHFGEMDRLGAIAQPDLAVYTNIGNMHLENLGNRDGVLRAKTELIRHVRPGGMLFFNGDDDKLRSYASPIPVTCFGMDESYPIHPESIRQFGLERTEFTLCFPNAALPVVLPAVGTHMVQNAVAAANVGLYFGLNPELIVAGIEAYSPVGHRGRVISAGGFTIVDDCYNAGPDSMRASIAALPRAGRRLALLGDMLELGADEKRLHYELGRFCAASGLDMLFTIGSLAVETALGAMEYGLKETYTLDPDEASAFILPRLRCGDVLLIKASRGMHFERFINEILEGLK